MQMCYVNVKNRVSKVSERVRLQILLACHMEMKPCQADVQVGSSFCLSTLACDTSDIGLCTFSEHF